MNDAVNRRMSTGNRQMDEVLHGGFPVNSLNIIMGQPGTGKTIFAEQMIFHHAEDDSRPIIYLTTLSEPVAKVLTYLQRFSFFDEEKIGTSVHYRDIGPDLAERGIGALLPHILDAIHTLSPKVVVIDSFRALHDLSDSVLEMRRMLYELTSTLAAYETTVFLVGEYTDENSRTMPEFAIADGILQFLRSPQSTRDERFMRVLKLRGSKYSEGLHGFKITGEGLEIYPRLVTPEVPENYVLNPQRLPCGVSALDGLIGGGLVRGSTTVVAGPTGSGKTTFSLQFALEGLKHGEQCLYVNFQENPTQLARLIFSLGVDPEQARAGGLELLYTSPVELQIDSIIVKIFDLVQEKKISRVVIDAIGDLGRASSDEDRLHDYIYSMIQHFAVKGVTTVLTYETIGRMLEGAQDHTKITRFSNMTDCILLLEVGSQPEYDRSIRCIKARGSKHDLRPHPFDITETGIVLT